MGNARVSVLPCFVLLFTPLQGFHRSRQARRVLYNFRILRDSTLGVRIAISNITAGGTGKTPVGRNSPVNCRTPADRWPS